MASGRSASAPWLTAGPPCSSGLEPSRGEAVGVGSKQASAGGSAGKTGSEAAAGSAALSPTSLGPPREAPPHVVPPRFAGFLVASLGLCSMQPSSLGQGPCEDRVCSLWVFGCLRVGFLSHLSIYFGLRWVIVAGVQGAVDIYILILIFIFIFIIIYNMVY